MSLTEKLLAVDVAKYKEKKTSTLEIKRLSKVVGEPFIIKIQEIDDERLQELQAMILTDNGKVDYTKARGVNALLCVESVIEPDLRDVKLRTHFGAATPKELAETLFKGDDLGMVADAILALNNYGDGEEDKKN